MNMYLQVLVETGVIGAAGFLFCIGAVMRSGLKVVRLQRHWGKNLKAISWLTLGCTFGLLVHGLAESSSILGATSNPLVLGFSIALLERLPKLAKGT